MYITIYCKSIFRLCLFFSFYEHQKSEFLESLIIKREKCVFKIFPKNEKARIGMKEAMELRIPRKIFEINEYRSSMDLQTEIFLRAYFHFNETRSGKIFTNLEHMVRLMGIRSPLNKIRQNKKFNSLMKNLNHFIDTKQIIPQEELDTLTHGLTSLLIFYNHIEEPYFKDTEYKKAKKPTSAYVSLTLEEYEALIEYSNSKDPIKDLLVYTFIKSMIWNKKRKDIESSPRYTALSLEWICSICGLGRKTTADSIKYLTNEIDLLVVQKLKNLKKNLGEYQNLRSIFVLKTKGWEDELRYGEIHYIKKIKEHNRNLYGKYGDSNSDEFDEDF